MHSVFISAAVCRSESTACRVFGERGKGKRKIEWRVIEVQKNAKIMEFTVANMQNFLHFENTGMKYRWLRVGTSTMRSAL